MITTSSYLCGVNFGRSYRYSKDLPEVDISSESEHIGVFIERMSESRNNERGDNFRHTKT